MPRRLRAAAAIGTALALGPLSLLGPPAHAGTSTTSFTYTGSTSQVKTLYDSGLIYVDGCVIGDDPVTCLPDDFPGTLWAHLRVGIRTTVVRATAADVTLQAQDQFRQDSTAPFPSTLIAKDGDGKEIKVTTTPFLQVRAAYDTPPANCAKDHVTLQKLKDGIDTSPSSECVNLYGDTGEVDLGSFTLLEKDATLPYSGQKVLSQSQDSPELDVGALLGLPVELGVKLRFGTALTLQTGGGYTGTRTIASSGDPTTPLSTAPLHWTGTTQLADSAQIPCTAQAGDNLVYGLQDMKWAGSGDVDVEVHPVIVLPDPLPNIDLPGVGTNIFDAGDLTSNAAPYSQVLGPIAAENKAPTVALGPIPTNGMEGTPIPLSVVGTGPGGSLDNCDATGSSLSYRWSFDDGSSAFGRSIAHAFADNNGSSARSGQVVVTDPAGNSTTRTFSVAVANVAPVVHAGPDTSAAWGRQVAFGGSAVDPGSGDQGTLTYSWSFGDGSPSATGGSTVLHAYAAPGTYVATLTVRDKDGLSTSSSRNVVVRKRSTTAAYNGGTSGVHDSAATLSATLTDEFGSSVPGAMKFSLGGVDFGTVSTTSAGQAAKTVTVSQGEGVYQAQAEYAGSSLYQASSDTEAFSVARNASSLTYTGPASSLPNRTVSLTAVLKDANGKPVVGRSVAFKLGSQTASGTTTAAGIATASLALSQKPGTYTLTGTWTPAGTDTAKYVGSALSAPFKINTK